MPERNNPEPKSKFGKFVKYFSMVMSLLYPAIGIYVLASSKEQMPFDPAIKTALGIILIAYGLLRAYRMYRNNTKPPRRNFE